jgi:hypothetical protein
VNSVRAAPHRVSSWERKRTVAPQGTQWTFMQTKMPVTSTAVGIHGLAGRGGGSGLRLTVCGCNRS